MTKHKQHKVIWLNEAARRELAECAEYAPSPFHVDRLEVPVEGLRERIERLERLSDGDGS